MSERTEFAIYAVTAVLVTFGLLTLDRRHRRRTSLRRFDLKDISRWLAEGSERVRVLTPVWIVLLAAEGAFNFRNSFVLLRSAERNVAPSSDSAPFFSHPYLGTGSEEVRWLLSSMLEGGNLLLPLTQTAVLALIPSLWVARRRRTFPFSGTRGTVLFWVVTATLGAVLTLFATVAYHFPAIRGSVDAGLHALGWTIIIGAALFAICANTLILPPLYAAIDARLDAHLSRRTARATSIFLRLLALQLPIFLWAVLKPLLENLSLLVPGFPEISAVRLSIEVLFFLTMVPFLFSATLPACLSSSLRETIRVTFSWWRREILFFLSLGLAAGLASGLVSLLLRSLWEAVPGEAPAGSAFYHALSGSADLLISLSAFCLLLGNWLEFRAGNEPAPG